MRTRRTLVALATATLFVVGLAGAGRASATSCPPLTRDAALAAPPVPRCDTPTTTTAAPTTSTTIAVTTTIAAPTTTSEAATTAASTSTSTTAVPSIPATVATTSPATTPAEVLSGTETSVPTLVRTGARGAGQLAIGAVLLALTGAALLVLATTGRDGAHRSEQ